MQGIQPHEAWLFKKEKRREGKDVKGKKVLKASIDSEDEDKEIEEAISEFYFMATEQVEVEDKDELQKAFEDIYKDSIMLVKKNKELKSIMEIMAKENKELKGEV